MVDCASCDCTGKGHEISCPYHPMRYTDPLGRTVIMELDTRAEKRIREIVREEIAMALAELNQRDTIPAPVGDSHSGAIVVPRGSSSPPPSVCGACQMLACVCVLPEEK